MIDRIKEIMLQKGLSPSGFADKIQVQRSAISHILNGRNKPSLELIQKIIATFPDINIEWLLTGTISKNEVPVFLKNEEINLESEANALPKNLNLEESNIEKIVIFFKNGSFKLYRPS